MAKGKKTCKILKEIRRQIAEANDIEYVVEECQYKGDCLGTCPKCEAEVRYLEQQLHQRQLLGKAVVLAGVSVGMFTLSSCKNLNRTQGDMEFTIADTCIVETPNDSNTVKDNDIKPLTDEETVTCCGGIILDDSVKPVKKKEEYNIPKMLSPASDEVYDVVDQMPTFPDGMAALMSFINKNFKIPKEVEEEGIQGRIICTMIINEDGSVSDVKVVKPVHPLFDAESIRVMESMPKWNPGRHKGKAVKVRYTLPIAIHLQ